MSSMDPMRDDSWTRYGIRPRISLRPSHYLHLTQSTKSSLLTRLTTQPTTYNSSYGQILRRFITTVDSSSPVTTKTRSSNPSTVDAPVLIFPSLVNKNQPSLQSSSDASNKSWIQKVLNMITCLLYTSPSPRDATLSRMPSSA